MVVNILLLLT